ncbi:MAG: CoA transferase subunit A [Desulfosalsimonas sp.]
MPERNDTKIMDAKTAIMRYVRDGAHLIIGNYNVGTCAELVFEVCRQQKTGLTLYSQSGILDVDVLINAGCADRLVTTYVMRSGGKTGGGAVERALQAGALEMEDYTNFNYNARLMAGMHGLPFMPVFEGIMATDLFKKRGFMGDDKYRVIKCPYTGKKLPTVPAATPDVCIVHVQRADKYGNAQYWGSMGSVAAAALCSREIIVSCEQIVEPDVVRSSPHFTIIPAHRTSAVVEVPWGAHPTEVLGHYNRDNFFYGMFARANATADGAAAWMDQWVYGCGSREAYLDRYCEKFGAGMLDRLRAKPFYSAPANYGAAFTSLWDENGKNRILGLTIEEVEQVMAERGLLYE